MEIAKARKFNERMGRIRYSKGGYIKKIAGRKYFDDGGAAIAPNITPAGVGGPGNPTNTNGTGIGGISNALGLNAQSANIQQGTNAAQLNNAYTGANNAINGQVALTNTLNPGVQTGVNTQNTVEQEALNEAAGAGPNPAATQLAQATGTNVANQAALAAGQRGGAANVGLMERQAAQTGAGTQQAAAGQAATLEAQQALAEQQAAAGIGAQQVAQGQGATTALNTAQQNEQGILQNANTSANNAAVSQQSNINNVNSSNNQGILGGIESGASSVLGAIGLNKGGEVNPHGKHKLEFIHKMTKLGMEHYDSGGSVPADPNNPSSMGVPTGVLNAMNIGKHADGGQIQANPLTAAIVNPPGSPQVMPQYNQSSASGGPSIDSGPSDSNMDLAKSAASGYDQGHQNYLNRGVNGANAALADNTNLFNNQYAGPSETQDASNLDQINVAHGGEIFKLQPHEQHAVSAAHFAQYFSKGGESKKVPAMVSPGERYLSPEEVEMVKHGADPKKLGKIVPGKDKVPGKDSLKNDTVKATLDEGGVVIPIHVEKTGNADKMRLFTLKSLRATGKHLKKPGSMKNA
jgi:hypothetical protein